MDGAGHRADTDMKLFDKKKREYPKFPEGDYEPVLRCSICNGEQILCARDRVSGELHELILVRSPGDIDEFCKANSILPESIKKEY